MKYIFFGTPEFAAIILKKLINAGYLPMAVVCNLDEPTGRKKITAFPPVKKLIMDYESGIKSKIIIFQPAKLRNNSEFLKQFKNLKPDLAIIAAYGKIIPKEILDIPQLGFINIHPSLLPKYRGASPIQYAILNGDKETGVTIMKIDEEMDHGDTISNLKSKISNLDTYESLSKRLAKLGAELLIKILPDYISGKIKMIPQEHNNATYTKIIKKEDGKIDWSKDAGEIEKMTRAYYPWPSTWTTWRQKIDNKRQVDKIVKIIETEITLQYSDVLEYPSGKVFLIENNKLAVRCGEKSLIIKKLQLEGGKIMVAKEFLNGHKDFIGSILG